MPNGTATSVFGPLISMPFELASDDYGSPMLSLTFPKHDMLSVVRIFIDYILICELFSLIIKCNNFINLCVK